MIVFLALTPNWSIVVAFGMSRRSHNDRKSLVSKLGFPPRVSAPGSTRLT